MSSRGNYSQKKKREAVRRLSQQHTRQSLRGRPTVGLQGGRRIKSLEKRLRDDDQPDTRGQRTRKTNDGKRFVSPLNNPVLEQRPLTTTAPNVPEGGLFAKASSEMYSDGSKLSGRALGQTLGDASDTPGHSTHSVFGDSSSSFFATSNTSSSQAGSQESKIGSFEAAGNESKQTPFGPDDRSSSDDAGSGQRNFRVTFGSDEAGTGRAVEQEDAPEKTRRVLVAEPFTGQGLSRSGAASTMKKDSPPGIFQQPRKQPSRSPLKRSSPSKSLAARRPLVPFDDPFASDISDLEIFGQAPVKETRPKVEREQSQGRASVKRSGLFERALDDASSVRERESKRRRDDGGSSLGTSGTKGPSSVFASKKDIEGLSTIVCREVPDQLNNRIFLSRFFEAFGTIKKVTVNPRKAMATIYFTHHEGAVKAKREVKTLKPGTRPITIFWAKRDKGRDTTKSGTDENEPPAEKKKAESLVQEMRDHPAAPSLFGRNTKTYTSASERYEALEERDKQIRKGVTKQSDLATAKKMTGTCPDLCPEKERYMREVQRRLSPYEMVPGTEKQGENPRVDPVKAVKEYSRSSADQEEPLPSELRPPHVLDMTMNYLMGHIMNREPGQAGDGRSWADWFDFLWNRTRSIRKEITQQQLCGTVAVGLMEKCARFHIYCSYRLCEEDMMSFDPKINNENLTKCLQSLKQFYQDLASEGVFCPNEAEFRAYEVLLNLTGGDILREVQQYRPEVRNSDAVVFALRVSTAFGSHNYRRFFRLIRFASFTHACILHRYIVQVRSKALETMNKAFSTPRGNTSFPTGELVQLLAFEDEEQASVFCESHGLATADGFVQFSRTIFFYPEETPASQLAPSIIEAKNNKSSGEVVNGGRLPTTALHIPVSSFDEGGRLPPRGANSKPQKDDKKEEEGTRQVMVVETAQEVPQDMAQQGTQQLAQQLAQQPAQQLVQQPAQQLVQQLAQQPAQQLVQQLAQQPAQQLVQQLAQQLAQQPAQQLVQQPAQQLVQQPAQQLVQQLVQQPAQQPAQPGVQAAINAQMEDDKQKLNNEVVKEFTRELFLEVIDEMVLNLSRKFIQVLGLLQASPMFLADIIEGEVRELSHGIAVQALKDERRADMMRQEEEKRAAAEVLRLEQELAALLGDVAGRLCAEIVEEVVERSVKDVAIAEIRAYQIQARREALDRCSVAVLSELLQDVVGTEVLGISTGVIASARTERDARLADIAAAVGLHKLHNLFQKWRRAQSKRAKIRRALQTFPAGPPNQNHAEQLRALWSSRRGQGGSECMVDKDSNGTARSSLPICLHTPYTIITETESIAKKILYHHYLASVRQERAWAPLNLPTIHRDGFWRSQQSQHCQSSSCRYWKLIVSLPRQSPDSRVVCDWLKAKLKRGRISEQLRKTKLKDDEHVETLSLYSQKECSTHLGVCTKAITGHSLGSDAEFQLSGASGLILCVSAPRGQVDCLEAQHRLDMLLSHRPSGSPVPIVVCVFSDDNLATFQHQLGNLNLASLAGKGAITASKIVVISKNIVDPAATQQLTEGLEWLAVHSPRPPAINSESAKEYLDNGLSRFFSTNLNQLAKHRRETGQFPLSPFAIVCLYNSVIGHLAKVASSATLTRISWPPAEFTGCQHPDLPPVNWNASNTLRRLSSMIEDLELPQVPDVDGQHWSSVCQACVRYAISLPGCDVEKAPLLSRVRWLLAKSKRSFEATCFMTFDLEGCEPTSHHAPWAGILEECVSYKMASFSRPARGKESALINHMVYFYESELNAFDLPPAWLIEMNQTLNDDVMEHDSMHQSMMEAASRSQSLLAEREEKAREERRRRLEEQRLPDNRSFFLPECGAEAMTQATTRTRRLKRMLSKEREESLRFEALLSSLLHDPVENLNPAVRMDTPPAVFRLQLPPLPTTTQVDSAPGTPAITLEDSDGNPHSTLSEQVRSLKERLAVEKQASLMAEMRLSALLGL